MEVDDRSILRDLIAEAARDYQDALNSRNLPLAEAQAELADSAEEAFLEPEAVQRVYRNLRRIAALLSK